MKVQARDTIAAISSAPLYSESTAAAEARDLPRSILRLSGAQSLALVQNVFSSSDRPLSEVAAEIPQRWRRITGQLIWREHKISACAYIMRSPKSYTREDIVELHMPGIPWLVSALLDKLILAGARLALPGEFTRRAVENGRITLEQAESIGAMIQSQSAGEARAHAAGLRGKQSSRMRQLRQEIESLLSMVELGLDFSHEDVGVLSISDIQAQLGTLLATAEALDAEGAREKQSGTLPAASLPRVLLLGPVNAGKSSLFNRLLGREAAIVSRRRHTTRDTIEEVVTLATASGKVSVLLIDSAGCGADEPPEKAAWLRHAAWNATLNATKSADIILLIADNSQTADDTAEWRTIHEFLTHSRPAVRAICLTKSDLAGSRPREMEIPGSAEIPESHRLRISSVTGEGIEALEAFLARSAESLSTRPAEAHLAAAAAMRTSVQRAREALLRAADALQSGHGEDVVAMELREAVHAFWQAEGVLIRHDAVTESALDRIFARFCIGK